MGLFIDDVRKELKTSKLPFVIGVIGVGGEKATGGIAGLAKAMTATQSVPRFKGNVMAVPTAPFWDYRMAELEKKKGKLNLVLSAGHMIGQDGLIDPQRHGGPGWESIGKPTVDQRTWKYKSLNARNEKKTLTKKEKKRWRKITLPEHLKDWNQPGFDDSKWDTGRAPIGVGTWKERDFPTVKYHAKWGEGEFILMRTTFEVADLDYAAYRLAVLSRQGFEIYLNGQLINRYIWWQNKPFYRAISLGENHVKHLKKGKNVLAAYANVEYHRKTGEPFNAIDVRLEGISNQGLAFVNSEEYKLKQMDRVCTREEGRIMLGSSNGGYHYLGSAKIIAQIGQAFAKGMLALEGN
jgi:hypothetical protein